VHWCTRANSQDELKLEQVPRPRRRMRRVCAGAGTSRQVEARWERVYLHEVQGGGREEDAELLAHLLEDGHEALQPVDAHAAERRLELHRNLSGAAAEEGGGRRAEGGGRRAEGAEDGGASEEGRRDGEVSALGSLAAPSMGTLVHGDKGSSVGCPLSFGGLKDFSKF
jgi:hypothetical protein